MEDGTFSVKRSSGALEAFQRDVLFVSIYESLKHRKTATADAGALTDTILETFSQCPDTVILSQQIQNMALSVLRRFDQAAFVHYQAFYERSV